MAGAARFPVLLSVALSALAVSSCGEIALGLGLLVCCVKVSRRHHRIAARQSTARPESQLPFTRKMKYVSWSDPGARRITCRSNKDKLQFLNLVRPNILKTPSYLRRPNHLFTQKLSHSW